MMKKISCDVIKDLISLRVDNLTSENSNLLIDEHLKLCESCKEYLNEIKDEEIEIKVGHTLKEIDSPSISEVKLIVKLRRVRNKYMILMALVGSIVTVLLTAGKFQFKAILFCPLLGAIVYLLFKRVFIGPFLIFISELLKQVVMSITGVANKNYIEPTTAEDYMFFIYSSVGYALIYTFLTAVGVLIGVLINKIFLNNEYN